MEYSVKLDRSGMEHSVKLGRSVLAELNVTLYWYPVVCKWLIIFSKGNNKLHVMNSIANTLRPQQNLTKSHLMINGMPYSVMC